MNCTPNIENNLNFDFQFKKTILIWTTTLRRTTPVVEWSQRNQLPILRPCTLKSQAFKGLLLFFSRPFNIFWPFVVVEVDVDRKKVFAKKKWETKPRQPGSTSIDKNEDFFPLLLLLSPLFTLSLGLQKNYRHFLLFLQQSFFGQMTVETWSKIFYFSTF